jgi:hypothetical protein
MLVLLLAPAEARLDLLEVNSILGGRFIVASLLSPHQTGLIAGIVFLGFLLLSQVLFRRVWLATGAFAIFYTIIFAAASSDHLSWIVHIVTGVAMAVLLLRSGLVSTIILIMVIRALVIMPQTADFSAWYSESGKFALAAVLLVAGFGFYTSTLANRVRHAAVREEPMTG